jgi:hypothetical protein
MSQLLLIRGRGDSFEPQNIEHGMMNVEGTHQYFEFRNSLFDIRYSTCHKSHPDPGFAINATVFKSHKKIQKDGWINYVL